MRIISKFADYYDYAASYGIDTGIVYSRVERAILWSDISDRKFDGIRCSNYYRSYRGLQARGFNLFVNGKIHSFAHVTNDLDNKRNQIMRMVDFLAEEKPHTFMKDVIFREIQGNRVESLTGNEDRDYSWVNDHFDSPIVLLSDLVTEGCGSVNPSGLKNLVANFIPGDQLFQEIEMYLTKVKAVTDELSDKSKLLKAGLDPVISFRHRK